MLKRIAKFDNMKFILIFLVVLGHVIEPLATNQHYKFKLLYLIIYSFHMPLFVFLSGYFAKISDFSNLIRKFLVPYAFFQVIYSVFAWLVLGEKKFYFTFSITHFTLWYLLALFFWHLLLPQLVKFKHPIIITFLLGIIIGYDVGSTIYFSFSRIICFMPYFIMGYYVKNKNILLPKFKYKEIVSILIFAAITLIFIVYGKNIDPRWLQLNYSYSSFGLKWYSWIYRTLIYLLGIVTSLAFILLVPSKKTIFTKLGTRTLSIYIFHVYFVKLLPKFNVYNYLDTINKRFLLIFISAAITLILSSSIFTNMLNPITGSKKSISNAN